MSSSSRRVNGVITSSVDHKGCEVLNSSSSLLRVLRAISSSDDDGSGYLRNQAKVDERIDGEEKKEAEEATLLTVLKDVEPMKQCIRIQLLCSEPGASLLSQVKCLPPPSTPSATGHSPAHTAAADPLDEPPDILLMSSAERAHSELR
ncbi:hypothetical protein C4D60_Mb02t21350 [Musa balbisiana]|uniref:Uncharacterized protein n=1 Tax=Musa balbisiana TaxID=52838 RepID=A0A4S8ICC0_MUSBA|nr:hypothetical protein C4D60_Mb02t21350 [Musa balbisiana]